MAHGLSKYFPATMTSGGSITSDIDLGRGFARVYVNIAGATNSVHFQAAPDVLGSPGTYATVKYGVASGMSAPQTATVGTATSGSYVEVPLAGFRFVKIVNVGGAADGATLKLIASDL
jgi:hypothetical protein